MKVELHMIQNFAPACLNRDDTNSPKDCEFGGVRRARISSQCIKRAIRTCFGEEELLPEEHLAKRTKRLVDTVTDKLVADGKDETQARAVVQAAVGGLGFGVGDDGQTQYLLFLGQSGIDALADVCSNHWNDLAKAVPEEAAEDAKAAKKAAKDAISKEIKVDLQKVLDGSKAADLALFGRMLADMPGENIDAACQVAHAISTNKVAMEMDFYTAVDDLKTTEEDAGAGMMGVIGYNSSCFYRYACLDWDQLVGNLGGDTDLARKTVGAFLNASAVAVPSGKQNTFAAHSRPDFILAVVRDKGAPVSLANAFVKPARPQGDTDLTQASVNQMAGYWGNVTRVYGADGLAAQLCCGPTPPSDEVDGWEDAGTLEALVAGVLETIDQGGEA
jgi:CRISPR system Cascade subunit CasC